MKNKTKNTHLLLQMLAVIGRYGPHLMIVMMFLKSSKKNFKKIIPHRVIQLN